MASVIHKGTICPGCGDTVLEIYVNRFDRVDVRVSYNDTEGLCGYCLLLKKYQEMKSQKPQKTPQPKEKTPQPKEKAPQPIEKAPQPTEEPKHSETGEEKDRSPAEGEPFRILEAESKLKAEDQPQDDDPQDDEPQNGDWIEEFEEFQEAEGCHKGVRTLAEPEQRRFSAPFLQLGFHRQGIGVWPRHFIRKSTWGSC